MSESPSPQPRALRVNLAAALLVLAALGAWANSFSGPFVFDDRPAILANPTLESFSTAFSPPRDGGTVAGRPLVNVTFALNRAVSGTEVGAYHAVNLLIHIFAGLVFFGLVRRTVEIGVKNSETDRPGAAMSSTAIAFAAALLWLVHPLQTAAVTYIVQRAESLMALCFLLTLYGFVRAADAADHAGRSRLWLGASVVACFAGMAAKEVMVVAPLVVLLYDRTFVARSFGGAVRVRGGYYATLATSWLLLGWLVATNEARAGTAGFATTIHPVDYALTQCGAIVHYLRLAIWPSGLVFDHGTAVETAFAGVWPQALLLGVLLIATGVALVRKPVWGFFGAAFFLILAPSSSVVPIATQTVAEHRMYLPLGLLAAGVALVLHGGLRQRLVFAVVPLAVALGLATFQRNVVYRDALTLWADTAEKRPDNGRAHNNLGIELARAKQPAEAAKHFELALRSTPEDAELHNNFGNVLNELGRPAEALGQFEQSVRLKPASVAARLSLAHALLQAGRPGDAVGHFEAAEALAPLDAESLAALGTALLQTNRLPAAIERYGQAVKLNPRHARAQYNLGLALARTNQLAPAADALREAVRLEPDNVAARVNFGNVLLMSNRAADAMLEYEAALRLKPGDAQIRANLSRAQMMLGRARP